jgi:hypothetical protein
MFKLTEIQNVPDNGKAGKHAWSDKYIGAFDFHDVRLLFLLLCCVCLAGLDIESPACDEDMELHADQTYGVATASLIH